MATKACPEGSKWDNLLVICVRKETSLKSEQQTDRPVIAVDQLRASVTTARADSMMMLSPVLWSFVVLATLGSILALGVWFFIYRRQNRSSSTSEADMPGREPLQKTEPTIKSHTSLLERNDQAEIFQRAAEAPSSPCHHLHLGAQMGLQLGDNFTVCRGPTRHVGREGGSHHACSMMAEHRIPLPATELGGTALVTTKTV